MVKGGLGMAHSLGHGVRPYLGLSLLSIAAALGHSCTLDGSLSLWGMRVHPFITSLTVLSIDAVPYSRSASSPCRLFLLSQPIWKVHQFSNKLFDQDGVFLAMQQKILHSDQFAGQWQKAYYMPTSCDGGVIAARRWIESVGQGGPPYDAWKRLLKQSKAGSSSSNNGASAAEPAGISAQNGAGPIRPSEPTIPSRREMMDRYSTHTQNCPFCRDALEAMEKQLKFAKVLGMVALLGLSAYLGSVGGVQGLLGAQGWVRALGWALVAGLAWCGWTVKQCTETLPTFHFVDFQHAKND